MSTEFDELVKEFIDVVINSGHIFEDEVNNLLVALKNDNKTSLSSMDTVVELFLDHYNLDYIRHQKTPFEVMALYALVGFLWEKGKKDVLTRPNRLKT